MASRNPKSAHGERSSRMAMRRSANGRARFGVRVRSHLARCVLGTFNLRAQLGQSGLECVVPKHLHGLGTETDPVALHVAPPATHARAVAKGAMAGRARTYLELERRRPHTQAKHGLQEEI
jgi:hypothetical protein